jgi:hypothetical protein
MRLGRVCEGYESYPVFINRGPEGLQKRNRFEEARYTPTAAPSVAASRVSLRGTHEDQILASFWDSYTSSGQTIRETPFWLQKCIEISGDSSRSGAELLRQVLLAIAYTRAGRFQNDAACICQGQRCYGLSLALMQQALYDAVLARTDAVLAAARCMVLFEGLESTTDTMESWVNQVHGIGRIVQLRRPEEYNEPFARAILESMRQNSFIVSIMTSTQIFYGQLQWRTLPWAGTEKGFDQRLYDHGFDLAHMFDTAAHGICNTTEATAFPHYKEIFVRLGDSFESLCTLNNELTRRRSDNPNDRALQSPNLPISLAAMDLLFANFAEKLLSKCPRSIADANNEIIQRFLCYTQLDRRQDLARRILYEVFISIDKEPKFIVAQLVFGLQVARLELRDGSDEADIKSIQAILDKMESRNHHRLTGSMRRAGKSVAPPLLTTENKSEEA